MAEIQGLDALMVILLVVVTVIVIAWIFQSMRHQFTTTQLLFLMLFCVLLGVFLESYFRGTRELVLSIVGILVLLVGWLAWRLRRFAKRISPRSYSLLLVVGIALLASSPAQAYPAEMHQDLMASALLCLDNDGRDCIPTLLNAKDGYGVTLAEWIDAGVYDCDRLDLARNHYYDPTTGNGLTAYNSMDLCADFYERAVETWHDGDAAEACYLLGRSLHMVQDSTVPFHGHLDPFNGHYEFEAWVHEHQYLYHAYSGGYYGRADVPANLVRDNAAAVYGYYEMIVSGNASDSSYGTVGAIIVPMAIRSSAALLEMFVADIQDVEPVLEVEEKSSSKVNLTWTPSADLDFVKYEVHISKAGNKIDLTTDSPDFVIGERDRNALEVDGLTKYGSYEFQIVTVTSDDRLESDVVSAQIGFSLVIVGGATLLVGVTAAIAFLLSGKGSHHNKKRRS